jgi:hypothetical protein
MNKKWLPIIIGVSWENDFDGIALMRQILQSRLTGWNEDEIESQME